MKQNATLLDVRTPEEFAGQHVQGAINIPLDKLARNIDKIKELPKPIMAYCRSGNRSGIAVTILKQHGISDAVNGGAINDVLKKLKR